MKVRLKTDAIVGNKRYKARETETGPFIVHDLKEEVAKDLIARGDATVVRETPKRAVDPAPHRAVDEAAAKAKAEAK